MLFFPFFLNFRFIGLFSPVSPPAGTREKDPKANKAQLCMHKHTDTLLHTALRAKRLTSYEFCIWGLCGGTPTSFSGAFSRCWPFRKFRYVWRRWLDAPEQYANSVLCIEQTTWRPICLDIFIFHDLGEESPKIAAKREKETDQLNESSNSGYSVENWILLSLKTSICFWYVHNSWK